MVEFFINGQQVDVQIEDENTIGDVLQSFEKTCEENKAAAKSMENLGNNLNDYFVNNG